MRTINNIDIKCSFSEMVHTFLERYPGIQTIRAEETEEGCFIEVTMKLRDLCALLVGSHR